MTDLTPVQDQVNLLLSIQAVLDNRELFHQNRARCLVISRAIVCFTTQNQKNTYYQGNPPSENPSQTSTIQVWDAIPHSNCGGKLGLVVSKMAGGANEWHAVLAYRHRAEMWIFDPNCNEHDGARGRATPNTAADITLTGRDWRVRSSAITGQAVINSLIRNQNPRRPGQTSVNGGGNTATPQGDPGQRCLPLSFLEMIRVIRMVDAGNFSTAQWGQDANWWGGTAITSSWIRVTL